MTNNSPCYEIDTQENVLAVKLMHTWDLSMTAKFCTQTSQTVSANMNRRWALIADISHWCLKSESACEFIFEHHKACILQGLSHQVLIMPKSSLKRWRIKAFVSSDYGIKTYFAEDEFDGVNWLRSKGFKYSGFSTQLAVFH